MNADKKKVLVITPSLSPNAGWGRYAVSVLNEFEQLPLHIGIVVEKSSTGKNVIASIRPTRSIYSFLRNVMTVRACVKGYDAIHAFDGWPYSVYGYLAVLGTRKKLFITGVATYSVASLGKRGPKGVLMRAAYRKARKIFCVSDYTKQRIAEKMQLSNLETVYMGPPPFLRLRQPQTTSAESFQKKYSFEGKHPILLTVGAIKSRKGQLTTLRSVELLRREFQDILYVMAGSTNDAAYVDSLVRYAKEHHLEEHMLIISDAKNDEDLAYLYSKSDVFMLNSENKGDHFEGFGLVILEANQFGKPAVGSKETGIESAIQAGYSGLLSRQRDPEDIRGKVSKILHSDRSMWERQTKEFANRFSWRRTALAYYAAY